VRVLLVSKVPKIKPKLKTWGGC